MPFEGCGSKASCAICDSVDNILVIQQDEEVQGEFDAARKISCSRTGVEEEKKVYFKPFIVQNLDVITVPTKHGGVDCWMDIQRGVYPRLTPIGEVIKIGEELTVLVYLRDPKKEYDLTVRNCWAYDSEDFDDKKTGKVQLSDSSGCTMYVISVTFTLKDVSCHLLINSNENHFTGNGSFSVRGIKLIKPVRRAQHYSCITH